MDDIERFWSKVNVLGPDDCWEWQAGKFDTGYGAFWFAGNNVGAHRFSLALQDVMFEEGDEACHTCDNPGCVNPNHLFLGTRLDNINDMMNKGRYVNVFAEREECSKGHKYIEGSFWIRTRSGKSSRVCKECDRLRGIKRRIKRGQNVNDNTI